MIQYKVEHHLDLIINHYLFLALGSNGSSTGGSSLGIQVLSLLGGLKLIIKLVNQGDTSGDVKTSNIVVGNAVKVLNKSTERVTVGKDNNSLTVQKILGDLRVPVRKQSLNDNLQGLSLGDLVLGEVSVTNIVKLGVLIIILDRRRGTSKDLLQVMNCSWPYSARVWALSLPWRAP